ncbi:antitoxin [Streptomyces sp. BE20]|uniref:antitoxin n=1 Tax=Streptomyces sp. BE20 TaxID=3002525 RepID=UPI002E765095|nr:antitoxin [Streptomyces sp. BE20]MEE1825370.1 antitoxin [Streptomyces sp. BE20]
MGILDNMAQLLKGHEDKAGQGIDKAGDFVDEKTQGKYSEQVDTAQQKLKEQLGEKAPDADEDAPPQA